MPDADQTRLSWDVATRNHNAHKGDQAAFLRGGGDTLFPEELGLLGSVEGKRLVHLQCNSGQDTLCLARRGAIATGVDFSGEAVSFALKLSAECGIPATFVQAEVLEWMHSTTERYDVAFSSYGAVGWLQDVNRWAAGIHRVLIPGGRFVYAEFHPLLWSIGKDFRLSGDDYFATEPFREPVSDYVASSEGGLLAIEPGATTDNPHVATSWQHTVADIVQALIDAGLRLEQFREYPHSNGCKVREGLVQGPNRTWHWPEGVARVPLMFGLAAQRGS